MAEGDLLPNSSVFGIACSQSRLNPHTGNAEPVAFRLKEGHEYVSGGWLDICGSDATEQIKEFCRQLREDGFKVTENYKIARLLVGETVSAIEEILKHKLKFIHHPDDSYECHSGMHGTEYLGVLVEEELAELAVTLPVELD